MSLERELDDAFDDAVFFAKENSKIIAKEILCWNQSSILPDDSKLRVLASHVTRYTSGSNCLQIAASMAKDAILEEFCKIMNMIEDGCPQGVSLRDYFAIHSKATTNGVTGTAATMMGIPMPDRGNYLEWQLWRSKIRACKRYIEADAMLAAREVSNE